MDPHMEKEGHASGGERGRDEAYGVVLFHSVSGALRAEKILKASGIPHKLIPVPCHLSSDCGICVRFSLRDEERVRAILKDRVDIRAICPL